MSPLEALHVCIGNRDLVVEFDRLNGTNLSRKGSRLDLMVDESSGRLGHDLELFVAFAMEHILPHAQARP